MKKTNYMKSEFEAILKRYGHDIFLQRRSQTTGTEITFSDKIEIHTVRYSVASSRSIMNKSQEMIEGLLSTSERIYYFKADAHPFDGDRVYEEDPRSNTKQTVWSIDTSIGLRGISGEIVFYVAAATRIQPN
jgi:hypothetical protein